MTSPAFIDLSHWNTIPESLMPARESGIIGVVHKATEGEDYVDEKLAARRHLAEEVGMLWGVYHFIRPGDVNRQVEHFLDTVRPTADWQTLYALDWEDGQVGLDDAVAFLARLRGRTGRSPVLYSGNTLKEALQGEPCRALAGYRLWLAHYAAEPVLPPGWDSYWAWQYTDQGIVDGIDPPVDLNAYGGPGELRSNWR